MCVGLGEIFVSGIDGMFWCFEIDRVIGVVDVFAYVNYAFLL